MNWSLLYLSLPFVIMFIVCQGSNQGYQNMMDGIYQRDRFKQEEESDEEEEPEVDYQGPDPFLSDKWYKFHRNGPFSAFMYLIFKYGQATCVEPVYDLAVRVCKTEVVSTPYERYLDICVACLLIRDLDRCLPPCSPNNYTCMFYPMNVDIIGAYNFVNNVKQGPEGFDIDQRG